jgi:TetR/AcrR family transcriptional regulator
VAVSTIPKKHTQQPGSGVSPDRRGDAVTGGTSTRSRILDAALESIAQRGYDATSLDGLASAVGFRKQTVLHHYGSKDGVLRALVERSATELAAAVGTGLADDRLAAMERGSVLGVVDHTVRVAFRLAATRPELIALIRETARLGGQQTDALMLALEPLTGSASRYLQRAAVAGVVRDHDSRALMVGAYARVIGAATEVEALRQLGVEPSLRILVRRQNELIRELHRVLQPIDNAATGH